MSTARKPPSETAAEDGVFDLGAYEKEAGREPFTFRLGGQKFTLPHLADLDWHGALDDDGNPSIPTVHQNLQAALDGQWDTFTKLKLSSGGYNELARRWYRHSGVELGEGNASRP